jgi:RNA polymerase sigma-32 factor
VWWIRASIQEYVLRSKSLVKMGTTASQKKLFFNLRKVKSKLSVMDEGDMRPDQVEMVAKDLGVAEQDVVDMNRRLGGDLSLSAPTNDDGTSGTWQDWLADDAPSAEGILADNEQAVHRREALLEALTVLDERERHILKARRVAEEPVGLKDLAAEFSISRERVRQIEASAFLKIRNAVKRRVAGAKVPEMIAA